MARIFYSDLHLDILEHYCATNFSDQFIGHVRGFQDVVIFMVRAVRKTFMI